MTLLEAPAGSSRQRVAIALLQLRCGRPGHFYFSLGGWRRGYHVRPAYRLGPLYASSQWEALTGRRLTPSAFWWRGCYIGHAIVMGLS